MDMREAFKEWWLKSKVRSTRSGFLECWEAACEWQKQKDAAIANKFIGCDPIVDLIINQGKDNG